MGAVRLPIRPRSVLILAVAAACSWQASDPQPAHEDPPHAAPPRPSTSQDEPRAEPPSPPTDAKSPPPERPLPEGYLAFEHACSEGPSVTLAAVGDLLMHHELQRQAYRAPDGFATLWSGVTDLLERADLTYANLEVPLAPGIGRRGRRVRDPGKRFDNRVYSGYPRFNAHPSLAEALVASGIDVVSTANNHALDRDSLGIDRTLASLAAADLRHTGTRRRGSSEPWHAVTEAGGLRIAWLACTLHTNFGKDRYGQVLHCFERRGEVAGIVRRLAADPDIDAVIVTPHFGKEYRPEPSQRQRKFTHAVLEAGATAVIGAHPHVTQPWERFVTSDGRETFAIYSLGNFASHQRDLPRRTSIVLYLGLRKTSTGVVPYGAGYVALHVRMEGNKQRFFVEAIDRDGGPDQARNLLVAMYGPLNLLAPDAPLDLAPHCDGTWPGWKP